MKKVLDVTNKPYNKCFACAHLKTPRCNGPRTSSMELARWCEYMRDLRDLFGLTNELISAKADVSIKTVNRIMTGGGDQDILRDTARRIEDVVLGNSKQSPCYMVFQEEHAPDNAKLSAALAELERNSKDIDDYRAALESAHDSCNAEKQIIREEAQQKIQYLLVQIERLRVEVDYLIRENDRKAKIIDKYLEE